MGKLQFEAFVFKQPVYSLFAMLLGGAGNNNKRLVLVSRLITLSSNSYNIIYSLLTCSIVMNLTCL